jgi:adenosylhomocysteine nucleosidase
MVFRSLLQTWLQNAAKGKFRDVVLEAAKTQLAAPTEAPPAEELRPCHLGLVFALGIESGCLEDLLQGVVTIRSARFVAREGGLAGRRVVTILSGPGTVNAADAADVLIDAHRPQRVISAGLAGGLSSKLHRNDIVVADRVVTTDGRELPLPLPNNMSAAFQPPGVHHGTLLTADRVVRLPSERQSLHHQYGALAVDMETFAVAEVCQRRGVPFLAVRVINDTFDETLPPDVEHLLAQKTGAAQWGAALGAMMRRPASAKDMYQLRENTLVASLRLAKFLTAYCFD